MIRISQLEEMIEHERHILDNAILDGSDFETFYEQSKKLDKLIAEYYRVAAGRQDPPLSTHLRQKNR